MSRIARAVGRAGAIVVLAAAALAPVGAPPSASAVTGGIEVPASDFPFVATYSPVSGPIQGHCRGTVIAPTVLLTAAHCAVHTHPGFAGALIAGQHYSVVAKDVHPRWNGDLADGHDLALLRLHPLRPVPVTPVQVGSPWDPGGTTPGTLATVVSFPGTFPNGLTMSRADAPLRSDAEMAAIHPAAWNSRFMLGVGTTTTTTCTGDDGAPALVQRGGVWVQVGVSSFPAPGCTQPGGFAELTGAQLAWVAHMVPSVKAAWGPCTTPAGNPGQSVASYSSSQVGGAQQDGNFWWRIACEAIPPPPPEPEPEPEPDPEPPDPPICRLPPWKCPDL